MAATVHRLRPVRAGLPATWEASPESWASPEGHTAQRLRRDNFIRFHRLSLQEVFDHIGIDFDPGPEFDE